MATADTAHSGVQLYSDLKQAIESGSHADIKQAAQAVCQQILEDRHSSASEVVFLAARDKLGLPALRELLNNIGIDVFLMRDRSGNSVVHMVAEHQSSESMQFIKYSMRETQCFKSPNRDSRGGTVAHCAARNKDNCSTLEWLLNDLGPGCLADTDACGNSPVHLAAQYQSAQSLQIIKKVMNDELQCFNAKGFRNRSALHCAAMNRQGLSAFRWLVEELDATKLTEKDEDQYTPVHIAAERQTSEALQLIKAKTNDVKCFKLRGFNRMTSLHSAAQNQVSSSSLEWLAIELGHKALTDTDGDGNTVIHMAAAFQNADCMKFIKEKMNGVECFTVRGMHWSTVVHYAALNKFTNSSFHWLVDELGAACLGFKNLCGNTVVHSAAGSQNAETMAFIKEKLKSTSCFKEKGENGMTAVHCAAFNTVYLSAFTWLLNELGPECLLLRDHQNDTVIHVAAYFQSAECMQLIKDALGDVSFFRQKGRYGMTVVHCAAQNKTGDSAFKWLVNELGPEFLRSRDLENNTPIHDAAEFQTDETMKFIKDKMKGLECFKIKGRDQMTVVQCAAMNKISSSAFKWLVNELGVECLLDKDSDGDTALHMAAQKQDVEILKFIKEKFNGIDCFKKKGWNGSTVVHSAASTQLVSPLPLKWLVNELGPECLLYTDRRGDTVIHTAAEFQTKETMQMIKEKLNDVQIFRTLRGRDGVNVVHVAALNKVSRQTLRWLIKELGSDCIEDVNFKGQTVIDLCRYFETNLKMNLPRKDVFQFIKEPL